MIGIVGVGSIGRNLLDLLVKKIPHETFLIIDGDKVNKQNIQYNKKYIGKRKVLACKEKYKDAIIPINDYLIKDNLRGDQKKLLDCDLVFDCRDTFEKRTSFTAIKLFFNKDKLIADFRKKITFKTEIEGDYVSYIDNTYIKTVLSIFLDKILKDSKLIKKYTKADIAISMNQLGMIEELLPAKSVLQAKVKKILTKKDIPSQIQTNVYDGLYNIYQQEFDLKCQTPVQILSTISEQIDHFPAIYINMCISKDDVLNFNIMNQTGGA